eukprot:1612713-Rhodomonas_salina.2
MSGTDLQRAGYQTTEPMQTLHGICLRACYAMSGTDIACGQGSNICQHLRQRSTCKVSRPTLELCDVRY